VTRRNPRQKVQKSTDVIAKRKMEVAKRLKNVAATEIKKAENEGLKQMKLKEVIKMVNDEREEKKMEGNMRASLIIVEMR
jgi:hypothetical protein